MAARGGMDGEPLGVGGECCLWGFYCKGNLGLSVIEETPYRPLPVLLTLRIVSDEVKRPPSGPAPPLDGRTPSPAQPRRPGPTAPSPTLGRKRPATATVTAGVTLMGCFTF